MHKLRTPHISKEGSIFSWTALIYGIGIGLLLPIFPTFVEGIVQNESYVGYFYSSMALAMVLGGFLSAYLYKRFSRLQIAGFFFVVCALSTMFLVFVTNFYELFALSFVKVFAGLLVTMSLSLMIHDYTASKSLGKTEGVFFLFSNIGWLVGPLLGGVIARFMGYEPVFALAGLSFLFGLLYLSHQKFVSKNPVLYVPKKKRVSGQLLSRAKGFFSSPSRVGSYFVAISFMLWTTFKVLVIPLFVIRMGYGSDTSGLLLSLSILPFIFFEIPVGIYADKFGVRKPIIFGFLIIGVFSLGVFFSPIFFLDALFIILANIGASFIEPLHDLYFFKTVNEKEEDDYYGIFVTADPIAKFLAPAIVSTSLLLMPFEFVFVVFGVIFLVSAGVATMIKH